MPLLVLLWVMGLMIFSIRFLGGLAYTQRLKHHKTYAVSKEWDLKLKQMVDKMKVSRPVSMLESALIKMPMVIGYFKPVILMPLGALSNIPADQLEAIISHELAHVLRKDYVINIIQSVIEVFFFFHPAVWWISKNIRIEREYNCDDLTIKFYDDPLIYVKALANIKEMETNNEYTRFVTAFSNGKDQLLERIHRMINRPKIKSGFSEGVILVVFLIFSVLTISTTAAISMRENNYDPLMKEGQKEIESVVPARSDQPLNLEVFSEDAGNSYATKGETEATIPEKKPILNKKPEEADLLRMNTIPENQLLVTEHSFIIPDTTDEERKAIREKIEQEYQEALKQKKAAEFEVQKALKEQQEAMDEYNKVLKEQQEIMHEQHRKAREEYREQLREIYKNDTLRPDRGDLLEDMWIDKDWEYDFDLETLEGLEDVWSFKEFDDNILLYAKPGAWTIYRDSLSDQDDFYFDNSGSPFKNWHDCDSGDFNWQFHGDSNNVFRYGAIPFPEPHENYFLFDEYADQMDMAYDLLEDELIIIDGKVRGLDLAHERLLLEERERAEDLAMIYEDEFPDGVFVPHSGVSVFPDSPDLGLIYALYKLEKIFKTELLKDGLIEKGEDYIVEINSKSLIINGEKQSREVYKKYKRLLESASVEEIEDSRTFVF